MEKKKKECTSIKIKHSCPTLHKWVREHTNKCLYTNYNIVIISEMFSFNIKQGTCLTSPKND